jgi:hypothetical protein
MMREPDLSTEGPIYMSFISHAQRISRHTFACAPPRHHYSQDMSNSKDEFPGLNGTFDEWFLLL